MRRGLAATLLPFCDQMTSDRKGGENQMKGFLTVALPLTALVLIAGVAFAQMGGGTMGGGMMGGMMGGGMGGMMGGDTKSGTPEQGGCHGMAATDTQAKITQEKAKELAEQYAGANLPGFTVTKVEPLAGMHMTMYSVELQGPANEVRVLHINPWGHVMPHGPSGRTS